jgi:hypothetical protein
MPAKEVFITGMSSNNCEEDDVNETLPSLDENILKILIYLFIITITTYLSAYFRCNPTKSGLVTVKV